MNLLSEYTFDIRQPTLPGLDTFVDIRQPTLPGLARLAHIRQRAFLRKMWLASTHSHE
jgi:hypothetical protein